MFPSPHVVFHSAGSRPSGCHNHFGGLALALPPAEAEQLGESFSKSGLFSAYTSRPGETGRHPFLTADGTDLRKVDYCVAANNHLEFNTVIEIESIGRCTVKDRMGRGGRRKFDIYFGRELKLARQFGVKKLKYRIVPE